EDDWTQQAKQAIAGLFETDAEVFFVFNGTAANALALAQICRSYHAIICHASSHAATDEAGAPGLYPRRAPPPPPPPPPPRPTARRADAAQHRGASDGRAGCPPCFATRRFGHAGDRAGYRLHGGRAHGGVRRGPAPRLARADGRRPLRERSSLARMLAGRSFL